MFELKRWSREGRNVGEDVDERKLAPPRYLSVHEFVSQAWQSSDEFAAARHTPTVERMVKEVVTDIDLRVFRHQGSRARR